MKPNSFPLDLSRFKKIKSSEHSTVLQHPEGHQIEIAHHALSRKMKQKLVELPEAKKMAEGGDVQDPDPEKAKEFVKGATESGWQPSTWMKNIKEGMQPQKMADGGQASDNLSDVIPSNSSQNVASNDQVASSSLNPQAQPTIIINNGQPAQDQSPNVSQAPEAAPQPASADPSMARKRELYNREVGNNFDPMAKFQGPQYFGQSGEAPQQFSPQAWTQAEQKFQQENKMNQASALQQVDQITAENKVRAAAGMPLLPVPQVPPSGAMPPTSDANALPKLQQPQAGASQTPQDLFGTQGYYNALSQGIQDQTGAAYGSSKILEQQGAQEAKAAAQYQQDTLNLQKDFESNKEQLLGERAKILDDIDQGHIDPNRYINSMGAGQTVRTAIGLILGGIGGGLTHQENPALKFLNSQIDRDIAAQQAELGKNENLLSANLKQFGNMRDAIEMTRVNLRDMYYGKVQQYAGESKGPLAKMNALALKGQLEAANAQTFGQIASRQTMQKAAANGQIPPEVMIRGYFPDPKEQEPYMKQLQEAQTMVRARDNILGAFDQAVKINTIGNRIWSPFQTKREVDAVVNPVIAQLAKDTAGRFSDTDANYIGSLFKTLGTNPESIQAMKTRLQNLVSEKMNFPMLKSIGINPETMGRYRGAQGQKQIQLGPVVANGR